MEFTLTAKGEPYESARAAGKDPSILSVVDWEVIMADTIVFFVVCVFAIVFGGVVYHTLERKQ